MIIHKRSYKILFLSFLALVILASGCAKTTVVLLPDPDGKVGHVTVSTDKGTTNITRAREATVVKGRESTPTSPTILTEDDINADFGQVLAVLPTKPIHFILYFKGGSTELTAASIKVLPDILESIKSRDSQNISVIGHTDTAGDRQYNMQLSQKRASAIRKILVREGVQSSFIKSTSHGENNPLVKTADNVHEPKNRRVEVVVR